MHFLGRLGRILGVLGIPWQSPVLPGALWRTLALPQAPPPPPRTLLGGQQGGCAPDNDTTRNRSEWRKAENTETKAKAESFLSHAEQVGGFHRSVFYDGRFSLD